MYKRIFTIIAVLSTTIMFAQTPQKMSYQAVIRNNSNALVINTQVGMQISILQGSPTGTVVYAETQRPTTNANGLVTIEIGGGTVVSGTFSSIAWTNGNYFIKTETDPTGGTSYTITGTSQLLSVPYALHAKTAETAITETDPAYTASQAANITSADIVNLGNLSGTNTGDQNLSSLATKKALGDSTAHIRTEIPDVSGFIKTETQNLANVAAINNAVNTQLKNVTNPTDAQDAATKAYVDALKTQIETMQNTLIAGGMVADYDGNSYNTVKIGNQVWMAENLKSTHFNDGSAIPLVTDGTAWSSLTTAAYCWYNNDKTTYGTYGVLCNWHTVNAGNLCPTGWHVPSNSEWTTLTDYLGGTSVAGGKLKETNTIHWTSPNTGATNETGFTALPGGARYNDGVFYGIGTGSYWWCATQDDATFAWRRLIYNNDSYVGVGNGYKEIGFSVRCVKN
jgi:uncharacterized protein (TIGR02145 family)